MHIALAGALIALSVAQPNPAPPIQAGRDSSWTMALAGDIMLGRGVKRRIEKEGEAFPFANTCSLTVRADLAIANLESPLTTADYLSTSPWKFRGDTILAALELRKAGFAYVSLANNHALDCGRQGFCDTQRWLDSAGIAHAGRSTCDTILFDSLHAKDTLAASAYADSSLCPPAYLTIKGIRIGFLSFCEPYLLEIARHNGAEMAAQADSVTVARSIDAVKDSCDLLVCSFHWGDEYRDYPTKTQQKLGHLAIDLGARVVHGHHPHVLEGVEFYQDGLIAYSLGNFIFDQRHEKPRQSALLFVSLSKDSVRPGNVKIDSVSLRPLEIFNNRPQAAAKKGWKAIAMRIKKQCERLGTNVERAGDVLILSRRSEEKKKPVK